MTAKLLILGIVGVLGYALLKGHDYYSRLAYRFVGYKITDISIADKTVVSIALNFQIYNPTPVTLTVNSVVGDIYVNNYYIGKLNSRIDQIIYSDSVSSVTLTVEADANRVGVVAIGELIKNKFTNMLVRFDGDITVEGIAVPVNIEQTL